MHNSYAANLIAMYRTRGLVIDTNLLLIWFIGSLEPELVGRFKRTASYTSADLHVLMSFMAHFERVLTTPHILTEVSNLAGNLADPVRERCWRSFVDRLTVLDERHEPAPALVASGEMARVGLTDAAVASLARQTLVVTDDLPLYHLLATLGRPVLNFNHIRSFS